MCGSETEPTSDKKDGSFARAQAEYIQFYEVLLSVTPQNVAFPPRCSHLWHGEADMSTLLGSLGDLQPLSSLTSNGAALSSPWGGGLQKLAIQRCH